MKREVWLRRTVAVLGLAILSAAAMTVRADDESGVAPARAVRLSNVDGQVQVAQGGELLADHALANTPLFEGSQIQTGDDGRAEVQFEDGSVVRIPPDSSVTLSVLKPGGETEMVLDNGMAYFELQDGSQGGAMRVRFGVNVVTVSGFTVLRIRLDDGPAEMAVFSGNAHLDATTGASMDVKGGESVALGSYNLSESIEPDSWDSWNSDRDQALTTADVGTTPATSELPNSSNPAWSDLNSSGTWYNVPDQGYVWSPYEASNPGWDPYGMGYWMWTPAYGYVWVSGFPWGYMPYQCGAWNWYDNFGWGWAPGMCNTWWGGGGWIFNVGYMPVWYRLPYRPHYPRPRSPNPVAGGTVTKLRPIGLRPVAPVITVSRNEPSGTTILPPRVPNHPVQIGRVVGQPVGPTPPRGGEGPGMSFHHVLPVSTKPLNGPPTAGANPGSGSGSGGTTRPIYTPQPGSGTSRPVYSPAPGTGAPRPANPPAAQPGAGRPATPVYTPPRANPGGGSSYRPAPSAPHPSGGGSTSHSSGGGGGGGSHTSSSSSHK